MFLSKKRKKTRIKNVLVGKQGFINMVNIEHWVTPWKVGASKIFIIAADEQQQQKRKISKKLLFREDENKNKKRRGKH